MLSIAANAQHSVARLWNDAELDAIRVDYARPTVHARNLFHVSAAMYDAWSVHENTSANYLLGQTVHGFNLPYENTLFLGSVDSVMNVTISYAAYRLLIHRFKSSPGASTSIPRFSFLFDSLGFDSSYISLDYSIGDAAALGNYIAQGYIDYGLQDGSNEENDYVNKYYYAVNNAIVPTLPGNQFLTDVNRWQPITFETFVDQSGNVYPDKVPSFLSPEWGNVLPFSLHSDDLKNNVRNNKPFNVYHEPAKPPYLFEDDKDSTNEYYKWGFELVSIWGSHLDTNDATLWDISPASVGNMSFYPTSWDQYKSFYNLIEGGDASTGHTVNPKTGLPYTPQYVKRGDYARVLAEFWADGPDSETPPGHWFTLLNYVSDHDSVVKKYNGTGEVLSDLEWDVKSYLLMGGAMHDAAVSAWGIKGWYDYIRPISAIRTMCDYGQATDTLLPNYNVLGIDLIDGYIELVDSNDALIGSNYEHLNKIKLKTWRGPDYISDTNKDVANAGWILGENWWPYQRPTFVTPPFAGYVSGHSTFSRAAANVMTLLTGDAFFPGGMGEFEVLKNDFLVFEEGPTESFTLQWATYQDASDQTSLSRIWGGIHPPADDIPGRLIGYTIGNNAFAFASDIFNHEITGFIDDNSSGVSIYPTVSERDFSVYTNGEATLEVYDDLGLPIEVIKTSGYVKIGSGYKPGRYIIKVIDEDLVQTSSFVKI